jgi:hypothetical protein
MSIVELMRSYCDEFVNVQNARKCEELMVEDYLLNFAGKRYRGRADTYEPLVDGLFDQFPDLHLPIHEMFTDGDSVATRFTLQGGSTRHGGNKAAWGGVAQYGWDGSRLTEVWVEEGYRAARQQLRTGQLEVPQHSRGPRDLAAVEPGAPEPGVLDAATGWLRNGGNGLVERESTINRLLAVGRDFAFHASGAARAVSGMATVAADGSVVDLDTFTND